MIQPNYEQCYCNCHVGLDGGACHHCARSVSDANTRMVRQMLVDTNDWERLQARLEEATEIIKGLLGRTGPPPVYFTRAEKWLEEAK